MTNQKRYPVLGSDASSVWNFCACFSDLISPGNQWCQLFSQVSIKERGFSNKSNSWPLVLERKDKNQKPRDKAFSPAVMTSFRLKLHHEFIREITLCMYTILEKILTCKPLTSPKESWKTTSLSLWKERIPKIQPRQRPSSIRLLVLRPYLFKTKEGERGKHFVHLAPFRIFLFVSSMSFSLDAYFCLLPRHFFSSTKAVIWLLAYSRSTFKIINSPLNIQAFFGTKFGRIKRRKDSPPSPFPLHLLLAIFRPPPKKRALSQEIKIVLCIPFFAIKSTSMDYVDECCNMCKEL